MQKKNSFLFFFLLLVLLCSAGFSKKSPENDNIYLTELEPQFESVGFEKLGEGINPFSEGLLVEEETISVNGTQYPNGLFAHAPSVLNYILNGEYASISGTVMMHDGIQCGDGVVFTIKADGVLKYSSPVMKSGDDPKTFSVDLTGAQKLQLVVVALENKDCDWSVWGDPVLEKAETSLRFDVQARTPAVVDIGKLTTRTPNITSTPTITPTPLPTDHPGWLPEGAITRFGKGNFYNLAVSPDNDVIAIAASGGVYFTDPLTGRILDFIEINSIPLDLVYSPDGQHLYIGVGIEGVQIWNRTTNNEWQLEDVFSEACGSRIALSGDGNTLLAKCFTKYNKSFTSWDISTRKQYFNLLYQTPSEIFFPMVFSPIDPSVAAFSRGNILSLVNVKTGQILKTYTESKGNNITDIAFSPDGKTLALSPYAPSIVILDAESLEEVRRIHSNSDVYLLSFIDNETIISFNHGVYVIQKIDGSVIGTNKHDGEPQHVVVPKHNLVTAISNWGGSVDSISLKTKKVISQIEGFDAHYWRMLHISGDGNAMIEGKVLSSGDWIYWISYEDNPDHFTHLDLTSICDDGEWVDFVDNKGHSISVDCPKQAKLKIADSRTMRVVATFKQPLAKRLNTEYWGHPWKDDRELIALLYQNPESANTKFRVEIRDLITYKKISTLRINEIGDQPGLWGFSNKSTYFVIRTADKKQFVIYDVQTGDMIQTIPNNEYPNTNPLLTNQEVTFIKDDSMLLILEGKFAEIYSIDSGELIQKYSYLKEENLTYFDETGELITFYAKRGYDGRPIFNFDIYTLDSNKVQKTYSVTPSINDSEENSSIFYKNYQYDSQLDSIEHFKTIVYQSENHGNTATIFAHYYSRKTDVDVYKIYFVDIPGETVTKEYNFFYKQIGNPQVHSIGNTMFTEQEDFLFKWDVSMNQW